MLVSIDQVWQSLTAVVAPEKTNAADHSAAAVNTKTLTVAVAMVAQHQEERLA